MALATVHFQSPVRRTGRERALTETRGPGRGRLGTARCGCRSVGCSKGTTWSRSRRPRPGVPGASPGFALTGCSPKAGLGRLTRLSLTLIFETGCSYCRRLTRAPRAEREETPALGQSPDCCCSQLRLKPYTLPRIPRRPVHFGPGQWGPGGGGGPGATSFQLLPACGP